MSWHLFDRIRALARTANVYQQERLFQDQSSIERLISGGELLNFSQQQALLDQTNLQINRLERYKDYDQMDEVGEMSLALDLYADESSLVDAERKHTLIIKAKSKKVKEELENLFYNQLLIDNYNRPMTRYLCKYGDSPYEIVPTVNRDGVAALKFMNVYNFTRVETKHGDLIGFFYQDEVAQEPTFLHPWQVLHLRLTDYGNIYHPYGRSIMEGGRKAFKQLRMMEDAALIYRITRAPEKRKFKIPIGNIPAKEVPEFIQSIARIFKNQRFYDPRTGKFNERFSPLIQEDDFFLPQRPDGVGPDVDILPGAENLDQIADIEYFKKKMVAPTKIPFKRVGIGQGAKDDGNEKSLASSDAEFAKAVQWVQREVATGLTKVAICHLAMAGYSIDDIKSFEISMSAASAIDELYRMETWQGRTSVMSDLKELGWFPREWIVTRFTDLSPDEIQEMSELLKKDQAAMGMDDIGGGGGGGGGLGLGGLPGGPGAGAPGELPGIEGEEPKGGASPVELSELGEGGENEEGEDGEGEEVPELAGLENINRREKRIINEGKLQEKEQKEKATLLEYTENIRRGEIASMTSMYGYLISSNEFEGLQDKNNKIIIEGIIDEAEKDAAKEEYRKIIMG